MSEVKGWYFPVKDTHAASVTANQTICLLKLRSLLDGTLRNCYAKLAAELINKKSCKQSTLNSAAFYTSMRTKFTTQCGLFGVD